MCCGQNASASARICAMSTGSLVPKSVRHFCSSSASVMSRRSPNCITYTNDALLRRVAGCQYCSRAAVDPHYRDAEFKAQFSPLFGVLDIFPADRSPFTPNMTTVLRFGKRLYDVVVTAYLRDCVVSVWTVSRSHFVSVWTGTGGNIHYFATRLMCGL